MSPGKKPENKEWDLQNTILLISVIVALLIPTAGFIWSLYGNFVAQQNIAKAFQIDVKGNSLGLKNFTRYTPNETTYQELMVDPIYTQSGFFYIYEKDITSFNPDLSDLLIMYYTNLTKAEQARVSINTLIEERRTAISTNSVNSTQLVKNYENDIYFTDLRRQDYLGNASNLSDNLSISLKNVIDP